MKKTKEEALELIDGKIKQFQKILTEVKYSNTYGEDYSLAYHGTESTLTELFSKEDALEFRKSVSSIYRDENPLKAYKDHIKSCISLLKIYRGKIEKFWKENESEKEEKSKSSSINGKKLSNIELETEIIKYLTNKVREGDFVIEDLSLNKIAKTFSLVNNEGKKRIKKILENLEYDKLLRKKSGINFYIPIELQKHPNIKSIKPINPYYILYSYIAGFVTLILVVEFTPFFSNSIIQFLQTLSAANELIIITAFLGFFLPMIIGLIYYKIYQRLIIKKPDINRGALITIVASIVFVVLCYGLLVNILKEPISAIGIIGAFGVGCALAGVLWQYVFKAKKEEKIIVKETKK